MQDQVTVHDKDTSFSTFFIYHLGKLCMQVYPQDNVLHIS